MTSDEKTYSFRIYPNKNQEVKLKRTLSPCRRLYNGSLAEPRRQAEFNKLYSESQVFPWGKPVWMKYGNQANELFSSDFASISSTISVGSLTVIAVDFFGLDSEFIENGFKG